MLYFLKIAILYHDKYYYYVSMIQVWQMEFQISFVWLTCIDFILLGQLGQYFLLPSTILGVCKDCDSYNYSNYKTDLNKDILIEQSRASYFSGEKLGFHSQTHYCDFVYHYPIVLLFINIFVHHFTLFKNNSRTILGISRIVLYALNFLLF